MTDEWGAPGAVLSVEHLAAGYGDIRAVWDVSLDVHVGSVTGVLGRNGAGKTTTLRAIAGLNRTISGRILLEGVPVDTWPTFLRARRGVALVQDGKRIFRRLAVEDNLVLGTYGLGLRRQEVRQRLESVYEKFDVLATRRRDRADSFSGGQQQMLAIAQALMSSPRVLMLDEPSSGLAPAIVSTVFSIIDELRREGMAILVVDQTVDAVLGVADRVVVVDLGRVVESGSPAQVGPASRIADIYLNARREREMEQ